MGLAAAGAASKPTRSLARVTRHRRAAGTRRAKLRAAAGSQSSADQLAKLADLRDRGVITAEEFDREQAKILA